MSLGVRFKLDHPASVTIVEEMVKTEGGHKSGKY
jgi:hypothetical protein